MSTRTERLREETYRSVVHCERCSSTVLGFLTPDVVSAVSIAEREAEDAGWKVYRKVYPSTHYCPRHGRTP